MVSGRTSTAMVKPARYLAVGGVVYLLGLVAVWLCVEVMHLNYLLANALALAVLVPVGYFLQRRLTFGSNAPVLPENARYLINQLLGFSTALLMIWYFVEWLGVWYVAANVLATTIQVGLQYLVADNWVFRKPSTREDRLPSCPRSIVLVTPFFPSHGGGVERVAQDLIGLAYPHNVSVEWYAARGDALPQGNRLEAFPLATWNPLERTSGIPYPICGASAFIRLLRAIRKADLVHLHECQYTACIAASLLAQLLRKPVLVTQHVGFIPYKSRAARVALSAVNRIGYALVLRSASSVVFVSSVVQAYFSKSSGWNRGQWSLIYNAVDTTLFCPARDIKERVSTERAPKFLFVGRFVEKKGLPLLRDLARRNSDWTFAFAGNGPLDPARWNLTNVKPLGRLDATALREQYLSSDLLVLPSYGEGFPLVVQEAMSCGLVPVVDSEVALSGGVSCDLALVADVGGDAAIEQWERTIRHWLASPLDVRVARSEACSTFARENWGREHVAMRYRELVDQLLRHNA